MGVIYVHDQNNPPETALPVCSHGLHELLFVQFVPLEGPYANGTPLTDRFTDYLGKIGTEGIAEIAKTGKFQLRVNEANVLTNWRTARVVTTDIEHDPVDITVIREGTVPVPSPITGYGTCEEWKNAVFSIFSRHGYVSVGPDNEGQGSNQAPNLRATIDEIKRLHPSPFVQWQHESVGTPLELRPRLFLPHPGTDPFERYADLGDWMTPLKWEHCQ